MDAAKTKTLHYKRSHFATQLPVDFLYSPSHFWLSRSEAGVWKVGMTKFASRMLGELVDSGFEPAADTPVASGQIIGWIEGFKAISDIYSVLDGAFAGANPALARDVETVSKDPYGAGWLYSVRGNPDAKCVDVHAYVAILDQTIDRILEKQKAEENP